MSLIPLYRAFDPTFAVCSSSVVLNVQANRVQDEHRDRQSQLQTFGQNIVLIEMYYMFRRFHKFIWRTRKNKGNKQVLGNKG
jgi:hypothetical protein